MPLFGHARLEFRCSFADGLPAQCHMFLYVEIVPTLRAKLINGNHDPQNEAKQSEISKLCYIMSNCLSSHLLLVK